MDNYKHLIQINVINETPLFKCYINDVCNLLCLLMKGAFEKLHKGKYFLMNGECPFRYNNDALSNCPCFE